MAESPFFSGRIPQRLFDRAEEYCKETGKKRTDLLIDALSTYLDFPIRTQTTNFLPQAAEVTKEMFELLQQQVNKLEYLITQSQLNVISEHEKQIDNNIISFDNNQVTDTQSSDKANISDDNSSDNIENSPENFDNTFGVNDNISDNSNGSIQSVATVDNTTSSSDNSIDNSEIQSDNPDNNGDNTQIKRKSFETILTAEIPKLTNITQRYSYRLVEKAIEILKRQDREVQPNKLLEESVEITYKDGIIVDNHPYKLFYCGENIKGKPVWDLIPDDNIYNQTVIKQEENSPLKLFE